MGRWTMLGNLDAAVRAAVDPAGLVAVDGRGWSLDWWVGAEDRWHLPAREATRRQALIDRSPVVETRVRVPSGDAVHRAYGARSVSGVDVLVVEIENRSRVPFALALTIRPVGVTGPGRIEEIDLRGAVVAVDGAPAVVLPKAPGRVAVAQGARDVNAIVLGGDAEPVGPRSVRSSEGLAELALLFPLAHTASLRVVLPLDAASPDRVAPGDLPAATQVAAGWGTLAERGTRVEVPDRQWREAWAASTRYLLLGARAGGPRVAEALDLAGHPDEAVRALDEPAAAGGGEAPGARLSAVTTHHALTADEGFAHHAAGLVATLVEALPRAADRADLAGGIAALGAAATLLEAAGERRAARDVRAAAPHLATRLDAWAPEAPDPDLVRPAARLEEARHALRDAEGKARRGALRGSAEVLALASPTWAWPAAVPAASSAGGIGTGHDLAANAELVSFVRDVLVAEREGCLALSPIVPDAWLGQGWELHDAPTAAGRLSYAIRWHGDRPALLWELVPHKGQAPIALTVPGLDPAWSSTAPSGEALLAPVAVPDRSARRGLSIPVSIEAHPGGRA